MDYDDLLRLLRALHRHDVEYVLVGGVAMNLHGIARSTEDAVIVLGADHAEVLAQLKAGQGE